MVGLAPSASAVKALLAQAGIESEILQRFLARSAGIVAGPLKKRAPESCGLGVGELMSADTSSEYAAAQTSN